MFRMHPARRTRRAVAAMAIAAAATAGATAAATTTAAAASHRPDAAAGPKDRFVSVQLLGVNDFHGNLEPPGGSGGRVLTDQGTTVPAGGAAYLATHVQDLQAHRAQKYSLVVGAGDLVGASPLISALLHDEPTVEFMDHLGMLTTATGNHEYDEGIDELLRLQHGGCHPVDGCFDDGFDGAQFQYLAANVTRTSDGSHPLPEYFVKTLEPGMKIGFIGMPLAGTPDIVTASGVAGLQFGDEVAATNRAVKELQAQGVHAIVLLLHQGDSVKPGSGPNSCNPTTDVGAAIARAVDPDVDAVFSGHSHQAYNCVVKGPDGQDRPLIQGASFGRLVSEIDLTIDRHGKDVVRSMTKADNHVVTRDVTPEAWTTSYIDHLNTLVGPLKNKVVGSITADLTRAGTPAGESALGDVIADSQLAATSAAGKGGAVAAFMNPGGIRADLPYHDGGQVTFSDAFTVQPFGNLLTTLSLTGAQIKTVLEQQFDNPTPGETRILQVSKGFTYSYDLSEAAGSRVDAGSIRIDGAVVDPTATYRITVNSFLAGGGDGFKELAKGTNPLIGGVDVDAFTDYLGKNSPVSPTARDRITRVS